MVMVGRFRGDAFLHQLLVQCHVLVRAVHYKAQQLFTVDEEFKVSVLSTMPTQIR